ncbi:MAG: LCP family protein [Anaerolineae bacterium]
MERWIQVFKWLILVGAGLLVVVGIVFWVVDPLETAVVVTPTPEVTPAVALTPSETPTLTRTPTATPTEPPPTWTATPTRTPTATPSATPTPSPTQTPTPDPMVLPGRSTLPAFANTPVVESPSPQPPPFPFVEQPPGTVNILLLGMDRLAGEGATRTDVIVIASIFPDGPAVSLVSIPRDYYAWIPAWGLDKINTAYVRGGKIGYPGGGPALTKATIEYNFGVPIHYYALVDFSSYRTIVDAVGGVDIVVECPLHDTYPDPESPTGQTDIDLEPGVHHLDGKYALWYVRSRWNTSDFDRHRRQQQVLLAILSQARSQKMLTRVPELWDAYQQSVQTDLGLKDVIFLASVAARLDQRDIHNYFIRGSNLLTAWTAPNGGYVLIPNTEAVYEFLQGAMRPLSTSRATQRAYHVAVSNSSWSQALGEVAAYRLRLEGFLVDSVENAGYEPRTRVVDFTTTSKGSPIQQLVRLYRLQPGDIIAQPTEGNPIDFRVVLGGNYNPCDATTTASWRETPTPSPTPAP